ncbi:DEAD/DEAH box helicase [Carnimonas nigrificans]|uniref:DEAD/DEAH box helicase n=1 Tax=Carnimonas nigrificans TaxID=64323 RepID=UPI00046E909F|nr:DEAD/DEAH box helicase [Carnimonas nigrificans]
MGSGYTGTGALEYVLAPYSHDDLALVECYLVFKRRDSTIEGVERIALSGLAALTGIQLTEQDHQLSTLAAQQHDPEVLRLDEAGAEAILTLLLNTERFSLHNVDGLALTQGAPRGVKLDWRPASGPGDFYQLQWLAADPAEHFQRVLSTFPPHYLDLYHGQIGALTTGLSDTMMHKAQHGALFGIDEAEALRAEMLELGGVVPPPLAQSSNSAFAMVPQLTLGSRRERVYQPRSGRMVVRQRHRAALAFSYGGVVVSGETPRAISVKHDGQTWQVSRDRGAEQQARAKLGEWGFRIAKRRSEALSEACGEAFEMGLENGWLTFARRGLAALRDAGWHIVMQPDFAFNIASIEGWYLHFDPEQFPTDISFGVHARDMEGNAFDIDLRAALARAISRNPQRFSIEALSARDDNKALVLELPAELDRPTMRLALPYPRLRRLLDVFTELRLDPAAFIEGEPLRWSRLELQRLLPLVDDEIEWPDQRVVAWLKQFQREQNEAAETVVPAQLNATLRGYQREGLGWLKRLQRVGAGGLLADDMGLGKTVQVIAFLLGEQPSATAPSLVVVPTSLLANWQDEFTRFAPGLSVLTLHGNARHQHYQRIDQYAVVLTSYPVLVRDVEVLVDRVFHTAIYDEAQALKNPTSRTATAARRLRAGMRLCLSGTPVENHLGELWSQFECLMPGLLGKQEEFNRRFRQPIEARGDRTRLELLLARLEPYLLRRTKEEVAADLPSKNEMVVRVELEGQQRERYEEMRSHMLASIEERLNREGMNASRMLVLEALLRLRQICCDARLVGGVSGDETRPDADWQEGDSAKLGALIDMLGPMLAAGRRVLIFSQFTSVLTLLQDAFNERAWEYLVLTGESQDRREPVRAFQAHEAQLMLISLKVGGTGLNLTAADTVILFDPWWNPAVENQAIDRAHRIGQDKTVFVYRLIARGTVEERIRVIQRRKAALSNTLLEGESGLDWSFDTATLRELFAPLDEE